MSLACILWYDPGMTSQTATSAVERSRRYRQRQRDGWRVVKLPVHDEYDRQKITEAIDLFLFVLADGAIEIDPDHFA